MRIPLIGVYNSRFADSNASATSSGIVGIGVVGSMIVGNGDVPTDKDQRFINCYPITVKNPATRSARAYLIKRPGFQADITPSSGNVGNAVKVWVGNSNKIISAFGATNSTIYDSAVSLGAITGKCTSITETILSGTANLAITANNSRAWYFPAGGALTEITDSDFPGGAGRTVVGPFAHLGGFAFIMDSTGRIYNSDLNSISAWTANSFATANLSAGSGVGCFNYRNHIIAFKSRSYEVWFNNGNATGSPLSRREEACREIGLINANAITSLGDTFGFVGVTKGALAVYLMDGFTPNRVSTPEIEAQLTLIGASDIYVSSCKLMGRTFIVITGTALTYVYCVEEQLWHEWNSTTPLWHRMDGFVSGSSFINYAVSVQSTSGKVFVMNPANFVFQDNGSAYTAAFQTSLIDNNNNKRKTMHELRVIGDNAESSSTLSISFSDDDYQTFSAVRTVDLSENDPKLTRCGSFRRRSIKGSHSANLAMRLEAFDAEIEEHAH